MPDRDLTPPPTPYGELAAGASVGEYQPTRPRSPGRRHAPSRTTLPSRETAAVRAILASASGQAGAPGAVGRSLTRRWSARAVNEGASCGEGDACTGALQCQDGACAATREPCADDDPCTSDSCSPDTGECLFEKIEGCVLPDAGVPPDVEPFLPDAAAPSQVAGEAGGCGCAAGSSPGSVSVLLLLLLAIAWRRR